MPQRLLPNSTRLDKEVNHGKRMKHLYLIMSFVLFTLPYKCHAVGGGDAVRAALFLDYAKKAKSALKAQDVVMGLNLTGHKYLAYQTEQTTNLQREFDNYLSSFNDILSLAADIYGLYFEVDQAIKNIKELKNVGTSCPSNVLAVALSEKKNNIYQQVIDDGIQIAADIKQILPLKAEKGKNPKLTQFQRFKVIGNIRVSLRNMNHTIRRMNRIIRYTTQMDSWYELRGTPRGTRSMKVIVADCKNRWKNTARTASKLNCK